MNVNKIFLCVCLVFGFVSITVNAQMLPAASKPIVYAVTGSVCAEGDYSRLSEDGKAWLSCSTGVWSADSTSTATRKYEGMKGMAGWLDNNRLWFPLLLIVAPFVSAYAFYRSVKARHSDFPLRSVTYLLLSVFLGMVWLVFVCSLYELAVIRFI